jgi:uncharacterized protein
LISLQTIAALLSGAAVGFSLGIVGGGGSILAVPLLLYVVGIADPHVAIGTSALAVALNAFVNLFGHWRAGTVHWPCAIVFGAAGVLGAATGSTIGKAVGGQELLLLFALVMIGAGIAMLRPRPLGDKLPGRLDGKMAGRLVPLGLTAGIISGFFGIGGGFLVVPGIVLGSGMPILNAIGSSLFSVGAFGLTTAVNYAASGLVAWQIAAEFVAGGAIGGFFGMTAAVKLGSQKRILTFIFVGVLFAEAAYMLIESIIRLS